MTHQQALAVRNGIENILQAFDETNFKVAIKPRKNHEFEVHIFAVERERQLFKAAFLWRGLEEVLSGTLSIESFYVYDAGPTESVLRESFKIW